MDLRFDKRYGDTCEFLQAALIEPAEAKQPPKVSGGAKGVSRKVALVKCQYTVL